MNILDDTNENIIEGKNVNESNKFSQQITQTQTIKREHFKETTIVLTDIVRTEIGRASLLTDSYSNNM